ncbi:hypothetical protein BKA66DRAFT_547443 [Pyrenochaeta sp. MPI-SDFR-AT-0127]|nr:hypothetical protein BKA66DRAFT_547443 [Pyrenochaeta sp. MPI-SDFR-AT-0127]
MATISAVRATLKLSGSEHANHLISLIDNGKFGPYRNKPESIARRRFGPSDANFPHLGKRISPFDADELPSLKELQEICLRDLPETREYFGDRPVYHAPYGNTEDTIHQTEEDISLNIINNLEKDSIVADYAISFQSEVLENMRRRHHVKPDNMLHASMTTCSILPRHTIIPLQHSNDGITTATLLSGLVTWIIWPPTDHNVNVLQTAYESFADEFDNSKLDITHELEGGIILVQAEGEALRIPPFCPLTSFTLRTSVLASATTVTADTYVSMLQKAPLLQAFFKTELHGERKQTEFNAALLKWLDRMLNGEADVLGSSELDDTYRLIHTENGPLETLLGIWDSVKDDIAAMIGPTDAMVMKDIWTVFLIGSKGRKCKICNKIIRTKHKLMRKHFVDHHWSEQKVAERVGSMGIINGVGAMGATDALQATEIASIEQSDDLMAVNC